MTKSEIINVVMGHAGVLNAEVVESVEPGSVTIKVVAEAGYDNDDLYNLRTNIMASLELRRPAGVGFEVVLKRYGDPFVTQSALSRFSAVAAEITTHIAPLKKPSPPVVEKVVARQLFPEVVTVDINGTPSPCPRCSCQAFTPDENRKQVACRGCPLPSPMFEIELTPGGPGAKAYDYRCCSCGAKSLVTMQLSQLNLYCWGCKKLTLHDLQTVAKAAIDTDTKKQMIGALYGARDKETRVNDPSASRGAGTRVFRGSKATFKFNGIEIGGIAEDIEYTESTFNPDAEVPSGNDLVDAIGYSLSFTTKSESGSDWAQTIAKLSEKVSAAYGMTPEQLAEKYIAERDAMSTPVAQLMEMFREKLGLMPFAEFEEMQRDENIVREQMDFPTDGRNRERRTGRTTRGLLQAIAQFVVSDKRFLCVVGVSERYTRDLWKLAVEMVQKINLARRVDIKPIFPNDFDEEFDYGRSQSSIVYVDHSWKERRVR